MRDDDNIRDIFNNSSLDDQDWLEPSGSVFQGIEEVIYQDEDDKKPVWLWVILGLFLLLSFSCVIYAVGFRDISVKDTTSSVEDQELINSSDYSTSAINPASSMVSSDGNHPTNKVEILRKDRAVSPDSGIITKDDYKSNINNQKSEIIGTTTLENNTDKQKATTTLSNIDKSITTDKDKKKSGTSSTFQVSYFISNATIIESFTPKLLVIEQRDITISNLSLPTEIVADKQVVFNVGTGISIWNYNLNDNYLTALSPADFTHSSGHGRIIQLGIEKRNTSFISFRANLSYESVSFQSGHNSNILYRNVDENLDNENNFNLDMATPLGGINSSIAVRRNQDSTPTENTLSIVLHNEHRYKNLDLTVSALQHLYENDLWNISTEIGVGLNHTFDITNDLSAVDINDTAYSIASINESSTQMDLNLSRASILLGINAGINLSQITSLNLAYAHKRDLSTIFSSGDFNTTLTRHQFVISLQTKF
jgi:hypothetical protein